MDFVYRRCYRGPLRAAIFDWAGTTVDYGCFAPTAVFVQVFAGRGVAVTLAEARAPMGLMKRDHIAAVARLPGVAQRWREIHGRDCTEQDVDALFADFVPQQMAVLAEHAQPIPGAVQAVAALRGMGLHIGSTTGYTRAMMERLAPLVAQQGYAPDATVCPDDVPAGRPYPWMIYENAKRLGVYPMEAVVKVGDTLPDIEEGLNAGCWTVGLTVSGNEFGLSAAEVAALAPVELAARRAAVEERMARAGAHFVVDGIWDLLPVVAEINGRLARGERP
jgi:phosphonoacetaldehyde hydrolase